MGAVLAVDVGGTNLRAAVVDSDGRIVARHAVPTPRDGSAGATIAAVAAGVLTDHPVDRAVCGLPGRVDQRDQRLLDGPHLPPGWVESITADTLTDALGVPVVLANDADVAAVGEAYFGAGRGFSDVVYVTISTGIGAGILVDGRILQTRYSAGEIGRSVLECDGSHARVEDLGSGTALNARAAEAGVTARGAELVALVRAGDAAATNVWNATMERAALGVLNLAMLVGPEVIVVGGGMGRNGDLVLGPILAAFEHYDLPVVARPQVAIAELGDDPGLIGAAAWTRATS
jgi:glucokinase